VNAVNNKKALAVVRLNVLGNPSILIATGIFFLLTSVNYIIEIVFFAGMDSSTLSSADFLVLLPLLGAICYPARNFRRVINLGGRRDDFRNGCFLTYLFYAAGVSVVILLFRYTVDRWMALHYSGVLSMIEAFGFLRHGPIVGFLRMTAFLWLAEVAIHTLSALQDRPLGWIIDVLIVAIISVFTPIAPLRAVLAAFFRLIIFQPNASFQIGVCLSFTVLLYFANSAVLSRKSL
jgi:hypothetical protein